MEELLQWMEYIEDVRKEKAHNQIETREYYQTEELCFFDLWT